MMMYGKFVAKIQRNLTACVNIPFFSKLFRNLTSRSKSRAIAPEALSSAHIKLATYLKNIAFLVMASCTLVGGHERYGRTYCLHPRGILNLHFR
jgi:hypothetical protein